MFNSFKLLVLVALGAGAWYLLSNYRIQGWENVKFQPRSPSATAASGQPSSSPGSQTGRKTIRIATANFGPVDAVKLGKPLVASRLAQILRQCDLWALQDLQDRDQGVLVQLVEAVNAQGRHYDFATSPEVGRDPVRQYSAFVFDADTIQVDRSTVAVVDDPRGQFSHPPLVGAFRARGAAENEAFTFTLINVHTPADRAAQELDLLAGVYRAVGRGSRNEDDVMLLGELGVDEAHLGQLARLPNVTCAVSGLPTTTRGSRQLDNLLFDRRATSEFVHRSGVIDLMRELNLVQREAAEVSEHLPVWAEFSVYEGGQAGHVGKSP